MITARKLSTFIPAIEVESSCILARISWAFLFVFSLFPLHGQIEGGEDEGIEEGAGEQTAKDDLCHGALYLVAREVAAQGEGHEGEG